MKQVFKPLGIAAAVAAASAGYVNVANAVPAVAGNDLGDLALVPYYTVKGEWITGISITNTSDKTQVVKFRFRRATDSMDALDFNVIMSPFDHYGGFLNDDENGNISWNTADTTCTAPAATGNKLTMPEIYRTDADTGYVEIIAMGQATDTALISLAAVHVNDVPVDCETVRSNFFADGAVGTKGVIGVDGLTTYQQAFPTTGTATIPAGVNTYANSDNALKVSYFIRDNASGVEFGDNAVHIKDFLDAPVITNQQYGYFSGDLNGFDFPDLNGGLPLNGGGPRGVFNALRASDVLGVTDIINEWTANPANGAALDWVVTLPGQYTMFNLPQYVGGLTDGAWAPTLTETGGLAANAACSRSAPVAPSTIPECDYRDMPVTLKFQAYNREEFDGGVAPQGGLVVSPQPPGTIAPDARLPKEANVVTFGGQSVLGVSDANVNAELRQNFGWVKAQVSSVDMDVRVCDWDLAQDAQGGGYSAPAGALLTKTCTSGLNAGVPVIGFAAWARNVAANPDASYGRIVEHSYVTSS